MADILGRHDAELGGMAAHGVDQLRPLADQQLARRENDCSGLLLRRLHRHAWHAWARCRLADGLGIIAVVLTAPDKWFHILWRDQSHRLTKSGKQPTPTVRAR